MADGLEGNGFIKNQNYPDFDLATSCVHFMKTS